MNELTAQQAIDRSASHAEIVHIEYSVEAEDVLNEECENCCRGNKQTDFWGTSDNGKQWRVILSLAGCPLIRF